MRCPVCNAEQGARRSGMQCKACGYRNVLNPREAPFVTDRRVLLAARRMSANGQRWYTVRQLVGELFRRRRWRWWQGRVKQADMDEMAAAVDRLRYSGAPFDGLVVRPLLEGPALVHFTEPDLFDYGAERILVVDEAMLVDLLVRNGVHVDARAIIVSSTGYPRQVAERAATLVRDRGDVPVYMLHASGRDATAMTSATRVLLASENVAPVDLGLSAQAAHTIRPIKWAKRLRSIPVDVLPQRWLTNGLQVALTTGTPLEQLGDNEDDGGGGRVPLVVDFG